jgi:hypothetical protein
VISLLHGLRFFKIYLAVVLGKVSPPLRRYFLLCHGAAARYFFLAAKVPKSALDFLF